MLIRAAIGLTAMVALSGCGVLETIETAQKLSSQGNCDQAISKIDNSILHISKKYLHKGVIYYECKRDRTTAINYLTMSARYGDSEAVEALIKLNAPVPSEDRESSSDVFAKSLADGLNKPPQGGAYPSSSNTQCRRTVTGGLDCTTLNY